MDDDQSPAEPVEGVRSITVELTGLDEVMPQFANVSLITFSPRDSRDAWRGSEPLTPTIVQQPTHNQPATILQDSYDVTVQVALPEEFPLRFRLPTLTLHITDADQDGVFVVTDTFSRVYGEGADFALALQDYLDSVLARFWDLEQQEDILAPGLRHDLAQMRRYITRTR